ncbi:MAG TPA: PrsW family glutamic-type intramembrane protease [Candidatus Paceibacterota bacterium]
MDILNSLLQISQAPSLAFEVFVISFIGGLLPALVWLWFWMHESHDHKEPRSVLWLTFLFGMAGVFLVFPLQALMGYMLGEPLNSTSKTQTFIWAGLEELIKYLCALAIALRIRKGVFDEPIDAFVYLMTAALGFSALENMLYLIDPLLKGETLISLMTGNLRFMGANLLHVASSGVLSLFIGMAYYKPSYIRKFWTLIGLLVATVLHALFNLLIIWISEAGAEKGMIFVAFSYVWITLIILILALEKVKTIKEF